MCLPIIWRIVTALIKEEIYNSLVWRGLFSEEKPECSQGSKGTDSQLHINQHILKETKPERKMLPWNELTTKRSMIYDMIPQNWIIEYREMYNVSDKFINFIMKANGNWKIELTVDEQPLAKGKLQRNIFHEGSLSPLLFIITVISTQLQT